MNTCEELRAQADLVLEDPERDRVVEPLAHGHEVRVGRGGVDAQAQRGQEVRLGWQQLHAAAGPAESQQIIRYATSHRPLVAGLERILMTKRKFVHERRALEDGLACCDQACLVFSDFSFQPVAR